MYVITNDSLKHSHPYHKQLLSVFSDLFLLGGGGGTRLTWPRLASDKDDLNLLILLLLHLLSIRMMGMYHHGQLTWCWGWNTGLEHSK